MASRFSFESKSDNRFRFQTSREEMERRWVLTLDAMDKEGIDCLVMWGSDRVFGGVQKYLSDLQVGVYPHGILFSKNGISVIGHGEWGGVAYGPYIGSHNIINNISVPFLPSIFYTNDYPAEEMCKIIKKNNWKRIGFIAMNIIPAGLYKYIKEQLINVELVDASDIMDEIKAIKSPYELSLCQKAVQLHEDILAAVPTILRVGRTEREVALALRQMADDMFCTEFVVLVGAHPTSPGGNLYLYQNNRINKGDFVYLLIELAAPGGFWAEIGRTYCMGEPSNASIKAWNDAVDLENDLAAMCKPGIAAKDIFNEGNKRLIEKGYFPETKFYAHGQGYDIVDRPIFCSEETMVFKENMYFSMHPRCKNDDLAAICIDNYVVTKEGGKRMSRFPQHMICLDY